MNELRRVDIEELMHANRMLVDVCVCVCVLMESECVVPAINAMMENNASVLSLREREK